MSDTTKTPYDDGIKAYADGYDVDPGITRDLEQRQKGYLRAVADMQPERDAVERLVEAATASHASHVLAAEWFHEEAHSQWTHALDCPIPFCVDMQEAFTATQDAITDVRAAMGDA
jgi:hypothetical protein